MKKSRNILRGVGRSFLASALSATLLYNTPISLDKGFNNYSRQVIAKEDNEFRFVKDSIPLQYVFHGGIESPTSELYFISMVELIKVTPEYEEIEKGKLKPGTGSYQNAINDAFRKGKTWIDGYFRMNDVVIGKEHVEENRLQKGDVFESVPPKYEKMSLDEIVDSLDETQAVIKYYNK